VYVPFVATPDGNATHLHVLISSVTFNLIMTTPDTNQPADYFNSHYEFRSKQVLAGSGGTLGRHGTCSATTIVYNYTDIYGFNQYSLTCFFTTPVKVAVGTIYWVNIQPKFSGGTEALLVNAVNIPPLNHFGWSNDLDNSFINSASYGYTWAPTTNLGALDEFSRAIAGTYTAEE